VRCSSWPSRKACSRKQPPVSRRRMRIVERGFATSRRAGTALRCAR
jgi:hypothetical protein